MMSNEQSGSEQRTQVRIPVDDEICVRDVSTGAELGTVANIHEDGFMVISDGGLKEDTLYQIRFEMGPNAPSSDVLGTECLWISETGTGDQVWAGFQIMELSPEAAQYLKELVARYES